jgi:anti-sigma regulatory factor (Ser/Thr protein kinase)
LDEYIITKNIALNRKNYDETMQSLTVDANLDSLQPIGEYTIEAAKIAELDKKFAYRLRLAIDEIATNIISYAYQDTSDRGKIYLQAHIDDRHLTIILEDTGIPFNPLNKLSQEECLVEQPLEKRPIGGLGIYLAIDGIDEFCYERVGDRNRNIFRVNRG